MARAKKQPESDEEPGAPEWMVTFSDCMTLLLTFFVLLLSFSSFDNRIFYKLRSIYSGSFTAVIPVSLRDRDGLLHIPPITHVATPEKGSEKETYSRGDKDGLLKYTGIVDLHMGMAFIIPSKRVFWGQGTTLSAEGRNIMDKIGSFVRSTPSRIVISEQGPTDNLTSEHLGLPRAWAVMEYVIKKQNLDRDRFSVSAASSLAQESSGRNNSRRAAIEPEREVEIVLLERSVYN